jgi:hypothetical protein
MDDILAIGGFFTTVIVIVIGLPLVKAYIRKQERLGTVSPGERERDERLARMETAIETMAVEIERISEGQRFVTRLLAEREPSKVLPSVEERR